MSDFDAFDSSDPTADFLEREKAILGAEAALFGNPITDMPVSDTGNTFKDGGFGDFIDSFPNTSPSSQPMSNTLFGASKGNPFDLANDFSTEAIPKANSYVEDSHNIDSIGTEPAKNSDSQALLDWQVEFDKIVQERDTKAKEKHERILKDAQDSLDKFYAEYNQRKAKAIQRNKELENQSSQKEASGNVWESAYKMISQSQKKTDKKEQKRDEKAKKGSDMNRFKNLMVSLKNDKSAPGVCAK